MSRRIFANFLTSLPKVSSVPPLPHPQPRMCCLPESRHLSQCFLHQILSCFFYRLPFAPPGRSPLLATLLALLSTLLAWPPTQPSFLLFPLAELPILPSSWQLQL